MDEERCWLLGVDGGGRRERSPGADGGSRRVLKGLDPDITWQSRQPRRVDASLTGHGTAFWAGTGSGGLLLLSLVGLSGVATLGGEG
jgi:hypothetical protein